MAVGQLQYSSTGTVTITLTSLGSTDARVGTLLNLQSSGKAPAKILFHYKFKTGGTPSNGGTLEFFWARANLAGGALDGNVAATDTGYTGDGARRDMLKPVAIQIVSSTVGSYYGSFLVDIPGAQGSLYVYNGTGAALSSSGTDFSITYETITEDIS